MNALYRLLYADRTLHGHLETAESRLRGWALLMNFPDRHGFWGAGSTMLT